MELMDYYVGYDVGEIDDIPKVDSDVWILGKKYNAIEDLEEIRRDIQSKLWCTYRRGFPALGTSQLTSDKGWGCMLRCGQMVLSSALLDLHLGRDWIWTSETKDSTYLKIVHSFEDNKKSPFSLHQIALMGEAEDKKVGEWFGPNTVCQVLKKLLKFEPWCALLIHVAMDSILVIDEVTELCEKEEDTWMPLLLMIPLRLGINEINPIYMESLKKIFQFEGSLGVIGGKPNQALYFIGYVDDEVLYLDPHTVQRSGSIGEKSSPTEIELDETFHQKHANRINFRSIDPSIAVCFLCKTKDEFEKLIENFKTQITDANLQPLFEITRNRLAMYNYRGSDRELLDECTGVPEEFEEIDKENSDDEFEIIE